MSNGFFALGRAKQPAYAARHGLAFGANDVGATHRAVRWEFDWFSCFRPAFCEDFHDLGNYVSGTSDDDGVANANVVAP